MRLVRRAFHVAIASERAGAPPIDELLEIAAAKRKELRSRRQFLRMTAGGAALAYGSKFLGGCATLASGRRGGDAKIVIVGAGLAGLNAAYHLQKAGVRTEIYEGSSRVGGRVFTASDVIGRDLTTELGGEFIDSTHEDILSLAAEFDLELLDMQAASEALLIEEAFFFGGRHHSIGEVVEAFRPVAGRLQRDHALLGDTVDFRHPERGAFFDHTSLEEYLARIGASGLIGQLLEAAYVAEFGLEIGEQSALNLILMLGTADLDGDEFHLYGSSDERYKIKGGNQRITDALGNRLHALVRREHRLEALRRNAENYTLTFATAGRPTDVTADVVLLAVPFSILRRIELRIEMPPVKRRAIAELGYGTNAKLFQAFRSPVWRKQGYAGNAISDEPFQCAWDNTRLQGTDRGGLTIFLGGRAGVEVGTGDADQQVLSLLPGLDRAFPGLAAERVGVGSRFHWPSHPWTLGSYSCYRPGQWTTLAGAEALPIGNVFFAGEHCSSEFQGFMNGAAESGRHAAEQILNRVHCFNRRGFVSDLARA